MMCTNGSSRNLDEDSWVDRCLDFLRVHRMHPAIEWMLAYCVALGCFLYYGFSYARTVVFRTQQSNGRVPLVTSPRNDAEHVETMLDVFQQIKEVWARSETSDILRASRSKLIQTIRMDLKLRQLVSKFVTSSCIQNKEQVNVEMDQLRIILDSIWNELLCFPSNESPLAEMKLVSQNSFRGDLNTSTQRFDISLIIPAFRETGTNIARVVNWALENCRHPSHVQVIIVDAGQCINLDQNIFNNKDDGHNWGETKLVSYKEGGGRGPSQNFGSDHADGRILTFLHCDTLIPNDWDRKVKDALLEHSSLETVQACAFCYGHDTSEEGLDHSKPFPWGIRSVWFLANLRAYWFNLPYGDHVISIKAGYFRYVGGFPMQKIMEDYDLMDLLRKRAKITELHERLQIIGPPTSRCSVRRWQTFGVAYVTLVNALIVHRYSRRKWSADNVFDYYYSRPFTKKQK